MKKLSILSILFCSFTTFAASSEMTAPSVNAEYSAVVNTVTNYFRGLHQGDQVQIASAFDMKNGQMKSLKEGNINAIPLHQFAQKFTKTSDEQWNGDILTIDIVDNKMAFVKFNFDTPSIQYTDYLLMLNTEQGWKITSKTYLANPK